MYFCFLRFVMSSQKDVQHSIAKWISALKNVPRGKPHKTIRELSNVQHHQLQSIKALCRHQLDMSTTPKKETIKLLQEWIDAPPSITADININT